MRMHNELHDADPTSLPRYPYSKRRSSTNTHVDDFLKRLTSSPITEEERLGLIEKENLPLPAHRQVTIGDVEFALLQKFGDRTLVDGSELAIPPVFHLERLYIEVLKSLLQLARFMATGFRS